MKLGRLVGSLGLLSLFLAPAEAQIISGGGGSFTGGTITTPVLAPSGCTNPPYSFTSQPTWGLCYDSATQTMKLQANGGSDTLSTFQLQDNISGTFLSFTNVAIPANVTSMAQDSSAPSLTTTVTNGATTGTVTHGTSTINIKADDPGNSQTGFINVNSSGGQWFAHNPGFTTLTSIEHSLVGPTSLNLNAVNSTNSAQLIVNGSSRLVSAQATNGVATASITMDGATPSLTATVTDGVNLASVGLTTRGFQLPSQAVVASASTITPHSNVFHVSGTTNIDTITTTTAGTCYTLILDDVLTVGDLTGNINLSAAFVTTANDTLSVCHDGTTWFETGRSIN